MRRLLVILMVMLIPLHGWSAQLMAVQMAQSQKIVEALDDQASLAGMPDDCPMLAQQVSKAQESPGSAKSNTGCHSCQLCMAIASISLAQIHLLSYERQPRPGTTSTSFISADLARQVKPPIH